MTPLERAQEVLRPVREVGNALCSDGDTLPDQLDDAEDHLAILINQLMPQPKRAG